MAYSLLYNGTLIDGNGGPPVENAAVLMQDNRIRRVGPAASIALPDAEVTQIDAQSGYILPGFIDTHVHLMLDGIDISKLMYKPFSLPFYESIGVMKRVLESGVTTVRDAGGADLGLKQAVDQDIVLGPRTQITITVLMTTGGYLDPWLPYGGTTFDMFPAHPGRPDAICDGVDGVRKKVREVIRAGADVIKLGATGPVFGAADPFFVDFTPAELAAIVEEAHYRQKRIMAHTVGTEGVKIGVLAGIHSIEHGFYLDDEVCELMAERGTFLVPTLMASDLMVKGVEANPSLTEAQRDAVRQVFRAHVDSIARAYKAGVKIAMGTDEGVMPHGHSLEEMGLMCQVGMKPMHIIESATRLAAENMGWADRIGTVEPDKLADIVVSSINPLNDMPGLANVENIALVIKDGKIVKDRKDPASMKAFRMHSVADVRLDDVPEPTPGPGEVILKPLYTGVCSTDLHILYAGAFVTHLPLTMGHEFSGEVVALGPDIKWQDRYAQSVPLKVGDRVCVEPAVPCMNCYFCVRGLVNLCMRMAHLGIWQDGSLAEYVRAPATSCLRLPDELTDEEGALTEVLACGLNFVEKAQIKPGDTVAVVGGGPMGQMAAMVALISGPRLLILSELSPERREVARKMGVHVTIEAEKVDPVEAVRDLTGGRGADAVMECVGAEQSVQQALDMTRRGGRCVLGGLPVKPLTLNMEQVVFGEKQLLGALASAWQFGKALDLILTKRVNPAGIIAREYDFLETPQALQLARERRELCKLMIRQWAKPRA